MFTKEVLFVHKICDFSEESPVCISRSGKTEQRTADKTKKKQNGAAFSGSAKVILQGTMLTAHCPPRP